MPSTFNGIGTAVVSARGFLRWVRKPRRPPDCDAILAFVILGIPLVPYQALHTYEWSESCVTSNGIETVESYAYESCPIRCTNELIARAFLRRWIWILFGLGLLFSLALFTPLALRIIAITFTVGCVWVRSWLTTCERRDQRIRRLLGQHRLGSSDPATWTDKLRRKLAGPRQWFGTDTFAQAVTPLLAAGSFCDATWAARLTVGFESPAEGERLTSQILKDPRVRATLRAVERDPESWAKILKRKVPEDLPLRHEARGTVQDDGKLQELQELFADAPATASRPQPRAVSPGPQRTNTEKAGPRSSPSHPQDKPEGMLMVTLGGGLLALFVLLALVIVIIDSRPNTGNVAVNWPKPAVNPPNAAFNPPAPQVNWPKPDMNPVQPKGAPPGLTGDPVLDKALAAVENKNVFARRAALDQLAKMQPNEHRAVVARKLGELLDVPGAPTPQILVRALGVWATPNEVPVLINRLDEKNPIVRAEVLKVLGKLQDERAVAPVVRCFRAFGTRQEAAKALCDLGPMAEQAVLALLEEKEAFLRQDAIKVLRAIGTQKSVPALQAAAARNDPLVRQAAQQALAAIAGRTKP